MELLAEARKSMSTHGHEKVARDHLEKSITAECKAFENWWFTGSRPMQFSHDDIMPRLLELGSSLSTNYKYAYDQEESLKPIDRIASIIVHDYNLALVSRTDLMEYDVDLCKQWKRQLPNAFPKSAVELRILLEKADQIWSTIQVEEISSKVLGTRIL